GPCRARRRYACPRSRAVVELLHGAAVLSRREFLPALGPLQLSQAKPRLRYRFSNAVVVGRGEGQEGRGGEMMRRALAALALCWLAMSAAAEPRHGISAFGDLKYPPNFTHFDYVNPDPPKGGRLDTMG